jgi:hypothetical protein
MVVRVNSGEKKVQSTTTQHFSLIPVARKIRTYADIYWLPLPLHCYPALAN